MRRLALTVLILAAGCSQEAARAPSDLEVLGVVEGKSIDSGFVFIDGRYVEAPYRVSRRGRRVLINDIAVYEWPEWPLMDRHVREDPGPPPKEYENLKSFADIIDSEDWLNSHLYRKRRYLYEHFAKEEADRRIMAYYRQCPFVASATLPERGGVRIVTKSGEAERINLGSPPRGTIGHWDFGVDDVVRQLEFWRDSFLSDLERNWVLFSFFAHIERKPRECIHHSWDRVSDLKLMVDVLRSDRSEEEKIQLLGRMEFLPSPNAAKYLDPVFANLAAQGRSKYETLIRRFRPSVQLNKRIEALLKTPGVKPPRTLDDLPEEIPWDRMQRLYEEKRKREQAAGQPDPAAVSASTSIPHITLRRGSVVPPPADTARGQAAEEAPAAVPQLRVPGAVVGSSTPGGGQDRMASG